MDEPIRVAQVMGYMNGGGVEQVVMNYYRHIDRSKVQFDLVVCEGSTMIPREEVESLGGRVFMVPPYSKILEFQRALEVLFHEQGWDIVHSHMNALSVFPLRAAKMSGVPIRIAHSHSTSGKGEFAKNSLKSVLRPFSNIYPTHRFACSRFAGEWLFGSKEDYVVLPNAIDIEQFQRKLSNRELVRSELGIKSAEFVVGHIGRFMKQKNHEFLLSIFKCLQEKEPNSRLLLIGSGERLEEIRNLAADLGILKSVLFLGQRGDPDRLYSAMDVFCLPSLYEGLPVVGVESQAAGVPILTSTDVTDEVEITSIALRMPLSSGAAKWADELLAHSGHRLSAADYVSLRAFDIKECALRLESAYSSMLEGRK